MSISNGWAGKILRVDLSTGVIEKEPMPKDRAIKYIGGIGLGIRLLYDEVGPEVEAFSPENLVIMAQGPLSGTLVPTSGRCELVAKSPMTGILGRGNVGGDFASTMKWAGYDLIAIKGKSEKPVYLWIEDGDVQIRDASQLWGQTVWKTRSMIQKEHKAVVGTEQYLRNISTLLIGPAGENLSLAAAVICGRARASGMGGIAAVWGSKNLKGIAIRGSQGVKVARPTEFLQLCEALRERFKDDPLYESVREWGTLGWVGSAYSRHAARETKDRPNFEAIEDKGFKPLIEKSLACQGCPLHCSHFLNIKEGKYKGTRGQGVEGYVQMYASTFMTPSAPFLSRFNNLCNQLGLNIASVGSAIGWAMELWRRGIITREDTGGVEVTEGNEGAILELTRQMAYREDFGDILADYPLRAAQRLGRDSELYATHNKGLHTWGFGPGIINSLSYTLANAVATRGFDHLTGGTAMYTPVFHEEWGITNQLLTRLGQERYGDPELFTEQWAPKLQQARVVYDQENLLALTDMTGVCKFASRYCFCVEGMNLEDMSQLLTAATGESFTTTDVATAAELKFALERAYNAREGIRRVDDYPFIFGWQLKHGSPHPVLGDQPTRVSLETYDMVLDEYYRLRGCDPKTGIPTRATLERLGVKDVADDLTNYLIKDKSI